MAFVHASTGSCESTADAQFMAELAACFDSASRRCGTVTTYVRLGGRVLALEFAGEPLKAPLTLGLVDVDDRPKPYDFTIKLWDTESTGIQPPPPPSRALLERGFDRGETGGMRRTFCAVSGTLQAMALEQSCAHYWVRSAASVPPWEVAAPLRGLLSWWTERWGVLAHTAVVGREDRGVLLAGASGAGKSTSALACLVAGMAFLSDDCALLTVGHEPRAHALYRTAKLQRRMLDERLPELRRFVASDYEDRGKAILVFPEGQPLLRTCRITAVVVQARAPGATSRLARVSPASALSALAPSTLLQNPGAGQTALERLAAVVGRLPCYALSAGSDLQQLARVVSELVP